MFRSGPPLTRVQSERGLPSEHEHGIRAGFPTMPLNVASSAYTQKGPILRLDLFTAGISEQGTNTSALLATPMHLGAF